MAYIGKQPSTKFSAAAKVDTFTGDGSTTTFDLANIIPAGGENGLQVFVDNVRQKPGSSNAFTVGNDGSGDLKRITFTAAPDASAEIYVVTTFEATNIKNIGDGSVTTAKLADDAVTSAKIADGAIVNADINASAAIVDSKLAEITTASKVNVSSLSAPGSASVFLTGARTYAAVDTSQQDTNAFNISLLGFKMAVNEGLTVFNLVDGIVDEFHDESGTDEGEGSNDLYCGTSDYYINSTTPNGSPSAISAGFTLTTVTESDTSTAGTNPDQAFGSSGAFTVPTGASSINIFAWGAGGSGGNPSPSTAVGGGGGFATGTLAVTSGQVVYVSAGEGAAVGPPGVGGFGGNEHPYTPLGSGGGQGRGSAGGGGGASIVSSAPVPGISAPQAPGIYVVAAGGGGGGDDSPGGSPAEGRGGAGGGTTGKAGGEGSPAQKTQTSGENADGGGGDQEQGGQSGWAGPGPGAGSAGGFLYGGTNSNLPGLPATQDGGGGGSGYYGGGAGGRGPGPVYPTNNHGAGGGGSSYHGHPQITSGSTTAGDADEGGGASNPNYVAGTNEGGPAARDAGGEDGFVLITGSASASTTSTTIVSNAFAAGSVPTTSRIVVFEENVATPTLNTDIIASISRDGGSNFTNATLSDSGYVTGSSGQRILTGQATISGQPSGQSMRWKLALANNAVKIHGVSLQWS